MGVSVRRPSASARPSVCRPLSQFPHMTLASSNMCDGRGREEEGEGEAGGGEEHLSLHLKFSLLFENEAALCSIARNPRGGISREGGSCLRLRPSPRLSLTRRAPRRQ